MAMTGARISELAQLTWADIDLEERLMHLGDDSQGGPDPGKTTKGKRGRVVPLHPSLVPMLRQDAAQPHAPVFKGPRGGLLKPDTVLKIMKRDVLPTAAEALYPDEAEAPVLGMKVHSLRHYFCTQCYRCGLAEQEIRELLGHRDSGITHLYKHLSTADQHRMINKLDPAMTCAAMEPRGGADNPEEDPAQMR